MKLVAGLQACGSLTEVPPSRGPACRWNWAQPGPWPPNTFHMGRLLRAHTGRGRAAEPGTRRAWERAARKEPYGWQGPVRPPTWPCPPAAPSSPFLTLSHSHPLSRVHSIKAPRYILSIQDRGCPTCVHTPTRKHMGAYIHTQMCRYNLDTETQTDTQMLIYLHKDIHIATTSLDIKTHKSHKHALCTGTCHTHLPKTYTPPPYSDAHTCRSTHTSLVQALS